jgi:hypothetical protein
MTVLGINKDPAAPARPNRSTLRRFKTNLLIFFQIIVGRFRPVIARSRKIVVAPGHRFQQYNRSILDFECINVANAIDLNPLRPVARIGSNERPQFCRLRFALERHIA